MSTRNLAKIAISEKDIRKQQAMRSGWEELLTCYYGRDTSFSRTMVWKQSGHREISHVH